MAFDFTFEQHKPLIDRLVTQLGQWKVVKTTVSPQHGVVTIVEQEEKADTETAKLIFAYIGPQKDERVEPRLRDYLQDVRTYDEALNSNLAILEGLQAKRGIVFTEDCSLSFKTTKVETPDGTLN